MFLGLVEDLRPNWRALFPSFGLYSGFWIGEFWPRLTRRDTSCRSLLGESDRLWGMISHAHFQARATLGASGKLGEIPLFFVTKLGAVSAATNEHDARSWGDIGRISGLVRGDSFSVTTACDVDPFFKRDCAG